jgi:hypothetical protein
MEEVDAKKAHVDRGDSGSGPGLGWLQRSEPAPSEGGTGSTAVGHGYHHHHHHAARDRGNRGTAALEVTPGTTVRAGTTIAISPSEPCDTAGAGAPEELYYDVSVSVLFSNNQTINQSYSADLIVEANKSSGQWSTEIAIPATTAPGPYSLTAMCFYGRTSLMPTYGSVPITVTAP